jgi:hypothetical protein
MLCLQKDKAIIILEMFKSLIEELCCFNTVQDKKLCDAAFFIKTKRDNLLFMKNIG